jgi:hypothetical protein
MLRKISRYIFIHIFNFKSIDAKILESVDALNLLSNPPPETKVAGTKF